MTHTQEGQTLAHEAVKPTVLGEPCCPGPCSGITQDDNTSKVRTQGCFGGLLTMINTGIPTVAPATMAGPLTVEVQFLVSILAGFAVPTLPAKRMKMHTSTWAAAPYPSSNPPGLCLALLTSSRPSRQSPWTPALSAPQWPPLR